MFFFDKAETQQTKLIEQNVKSIKFDKNPHTTVIESVEKIPLIGNSMAEIASFVNWLASIEDSRFLERLLDTHFLDKTEKDILYILCLQRIGELESDNLIKDIENQKNTMLPPDLQLSAKFAGVISRDSTAALKLINTLEDGELRNGLAQQWFRGMKKQWTERDEALLNSISNPVVKGEAYAAKIMINAPDGKERYESILHALSSEEMTDNTATSMLYVLNKTVDLEDTDLMSRSLELAATRNQSLLQGLSESILLVSHTNPKVGIAMLERLTTPTDAGDLSPLGTALMEPRSLFSFFKSWAIGNHNSLGEWLSNHPDNKFYDVGADYLSQVLEDINPEAAESWRASKRNHN